MTYCLAMRLEGGLVFASDTRTNAGVDDVGTYRKLHEFRPAPDRVFVLQSAGNLATTQEVLDLVRRDLGAPGDHESLATVGRLFEAALYVGRLIRRVVDAHSDAFGGGPGATATFILGGQIGDEAPDILLVYPEGNYIRASDERPFLQIGESKYGKFMLEYAARAHVDMLTATKVALGSLMSTAQANLSVGPPYDIGVYPAGSYDVRQVRVPADSPLLDKLNRVWTRHLVEALRDLPDISSEDFTVADDPTEHLRP